MADFDDDDFDIDELLGQIDAGEAKGKTSESESTGDKKSTGKAVRFSDDGPTPSGSAEPNTTDELLAKIPRSQRAPPNASLRTMFFPDSQSSAGQSGATSKPPPTTASSRSRSSNASSGVAKDDWLGIHKDQASRSPSTSPPPRSRSSRSQVPATTVSEQKLGAADQTKHAGNSSDEEEALLKDLAGVIPQSGRRSASKPPQIPTAQQRPSSGSNPLLRNISGASLDTTPPMSLGGGSSKELSKVPPKAIFSGSVLDQLGRSPSTSPRGSVDAGKSATTFSSKNPPLPSLTSLLETNPGPPASTAPLQYSQPAFAPKLPNAEPLSSAFSLTAPAVVPEPTTTAPAIKKKVVKKDTNSGGIAYGGSSTLQLPSHLINEEELKAMSASLKTLYTNQLEQLQSSYKDQINFLSEANKRKEELHREEMNAMQREFEERLDRLRNEIRQLESKETLKAQLPREEMQTITTLSEQLRGSIVILQDVFNKSQENLNGESNTNLVLQDTLRNLLRENHEKSQNKLEGMEDKVCGAVKAVDESVARRFSLMNDAWRNLIGQVKQNMSDLLEAARLNSNGMGAVELIKFEEKVGMKLDTLTGSLERLAVGNKEETSVKLVAKIEETEKSLLMELVKIHKLQRRTKESTDGLSLEPLVKVLESDREDDQRRREKLSVQIKEMRRDLKRILIEAESRQETSQKYNYLTETELKSISQSVRDLNSQLKINLVSSAATQSDSLTNQFNTNMQQTQAEMEMKMLRDERQALSESMAQINVEKRKLSEEKIHLEKQKLDFERERDRIRNLDMHLKTKLEETEEIQKKTESVRREEIQLTTEAQVKLKEMEKEKFFLKGKLMEADQRFLVWEQKLRQDKMELERERDFLEKLRDQLLCPGCMKPNEAAAGVVVHLPPPPYIPLDSTTTSFLNNRPPVPNFINDYFSVNGDELCDAIRRKYPI